MCKKEQSDQMKLIIIFITYLLGGVVDAVCGGGGLITLPVLFAIGVPAHIAVGTNQTSILPGVITSVVKFHKSGKIDIKNAIYAVPFGLIGGFAGARLNLLVSEWYLQVILLILIPVLAVFSVLKPNVGTEDRSKENTRRRTIILSAVIGFSVGAYHAFYGPASGTFYMLAFAAFLKYDLVTANGNSRFITMFVSIISSLTYALFGCVQWLYVLLAVPGYALGNYIGASLAISKGARFVRPMYFGILALLFIKLVKDLVF